MKSYALRYRYRGRMTKLTLGDVSIGLAAARKLAGDAKFEVARGNDPAEAKRQAKHAQAAAIADSFRDVAERYMKLEGVKLRSARERQRILQRLVYPALGERRSARSSARRSPESWMRSRSAAGRFRRP